MKETKETRGRPKSKDPVVKITFTIPKSLLKHIEPRHEEARSRRIVNLIKIGVEAEKKGGKP